MLKQEIPMSFKSHFQKLSVAFVCLILTGNLAAQTNSRQTAQPATNPRFAVRINVGGERYLDSNGQEWLADHIYGADFYGYLGISGTFNSTNPIKNTADPTIYQSERYQLFGYRVQAPNGHYFIKLHFAEIYYDKTGRRLFDINLEGQTVQRNLDIFEMAGKNQALVLTFDTKALGIPITDGRVDLEFINKRDDTKLSGLEIIQQAGQPALLKINPPKIDFEENSAFKILEVQNIGSESVAWKITALPRWLKPLLPPSGALEAGQTARVRLEILPSAISSGITSDSLVLSGPEFRQAIPLQVVVSGPARLELETPRLDFESGGRSQTCVLKNTGGSDLKWAFDRAWPRWIKRIYPESGTLPMGQATFVNITISREALPAGVHQQILTLNSNGGNQPVTVKVTVPDRTTRHVFVAGNALGRHDGSSWEDAFPRIEDALAFARQSAPIQIWVAQGTYYAHGLHLPSGVEIYGGFQGDETNLAERRNNWVFPTIVDGERRGRCFEAEHKTVIDGLVIQNGRDWNSGDGKGAAILTYDADVIIRNNLIRDNVDSWAGAIFVEGFELKKKVKGASPLIERNVLINNVSNYCAAAIEIRGSAATIRNNTIVRNSGYGLEIQDLLGPYQQVTYGNFYNNIVVENKRNSEPNDVWAEARKATNYSLVGTRWHLKGAYPPYDYGKGNIFAEESSTKAGFIDADAGDFRLRADSPAIDAGAPTSPNDPDGSRADLGAFPFHKNTGVLEVPPEPIFLNAQTPSQTIILKAFGGKSVPWQAQVFSSGGHLRLEPESGFVANGKPVKIKISASGTEAFDGYLAFLSPGSSQEVAFSVNPDATAPFISAAPEQLVVKAEMNGPSPTPETIKILNLGGGNLTWAALVKTQSPWIKLMNPSGAAGQPLGLAFETTQLGYGNYHAEVKIMSSGAVNQSVTIPVKLEIRPGKYIFEIEAEASRSLPNRGWQKIQQAGATGLRAVSNAPRQPNDSTRIDFEFDVPEGLEYIYIFAEVDAQQSRDSDSFWAMVNTFDPCSWNYLGTKYAGWQREWVFNHPLDKKHMFVVIPGKNRFNLFSRESGTGINWIVITSDPDLNIQTYRFGAGGSPARSGR
jgi:hypothetical protein